MPYITSIMPYTSSILLNSAVLYPTLFQLCLTCRTFPQFCSTFLNYAPHSFNSGNIRFIMPYTSSILLISAVLYPTLFQLCLTCLTVRRFCSTLLNYALHSFNSADVAQSHPILRRFCSNRLNYVLNYLNHSLHLLNSTQCSSIVPYIHSILQILLNHTPYFLNSAQICSIMS